MLLRTHQEGRALHAADQVRTCGTPVSSFGIVCYRRRGPSCPLEYLMVQRKDSLSYVEFIRGKYNLQNRAYLLRLLSNMTRGERERLRSSEFDALWHGFWQSDHSRSFMKEYEQSKARFEALRRGYYLRPPQVQVQVQPPPPPPPPPHPPPQQKQQQQQEEEEQQQQQQQQDDDDPTPQQELVLFGLGVALDATVAEHDETEFGFPKGRRNVNESDLQCALREFAEESGISASDLRLSGTLASPFEEVFTGSNNVRYRHVYYLAELRASSSAFDEVGVKPVVDAVQLREVKATGWFDAEGVLARIRKHNVERRDLFSCLDRSLCQAQMEDQQQNKRPLNPRARPFFIAASSTRRHEEE